MPKAFHTPVCPSGRVGLAEGLLDLAEKSQLLSQDSPDPPFSHPDPFFPQSISKQSTFRDPKVHHCAVPKFVPKILRQKCGTLEACLCRSGRCDLPGPPIAKILSRLSDLCHEQLARTGNPLGESGGPRPMWQIFVFCFFHESQR